MLFLKDEYFENTDMRIINLWSTQYGAERADHNQLFGYRIQDACDKFGVKNSLALFAYAATISQWYSKAPRDRAGQVAWCENLAEQFSKLDDIRLMPMTEDELVIMTLVWTQATARLNEYAKFKKPVPPKLPDPKQKPEPVEVKKKGEEPKVEGPKVPAKPKPPVKEEPAKVDEKTMWRRAIGAISGVIAIFIDKIPLPLPVKYILKAIFYTIASILK